MNLIWIIILVLIVISLFSGTGRFYYSKTKKRGGKSQSGTANDAFENNKRIWQHNTSKTIAVPFFNYQENYNEFPFFSDYALSREYLIHKKVSHKNIELFLKRMEDYESQLLRIWSEQQRRLLRVFDQTQLGTSQTAVMFLLNFYNYFLDAFRQNIITFLIQKILVAELGKACAMKPEEVVKASDYQSYINRALESFYMQLNADVNQIIQHLYQEIQNQYQQFFNQFNSQQNTQQQQQQQTSFAQEFDEIALAYKTLGVAGDVSDEELKSSYRKLAMKYHPDKNPRPEAREKMAKINSAYDLIKKMRNIK